MAFKFFICEKEYLEVHTCIPYFTTLTKRLRLYLVLITTEFDTLIIFELLSTIHQVIKTITIPLMLSGHTYALHILEGKTEGFLPYRHFLFGCFFFFPGFSNCKFSISALLTSRFPFFVFFSRSRYFSFSSSYDGRIGFVSFCIP